MNEQQRHDRLKARYKELKQSKESKMTNRPNKDNIMTNKQLHNDYNELQQRDAKKTNAEIAEMSLEQRTEYYQEREQLAEDARKFWEQSAAYCKEQARRAEGARKSARQKANSCKELIRWDALTPEEQVAELTAYRADLLYPEDGEINIWRFGPNGLELDLDSPFN